jgi:hypothetical protein
MTIAVAVMSIAAAACHHGVTRPETGVTTTREVHRANGGWRSLFDG